MYCMWYPDMTGCSGRLLQQNNTSFKTEATAELKKLCSGYWRSIPVCSDSWWMNHNKERTYDFCCKDDTAKCKSCSEDKSVEDYCQDNANTPGCDNI